MSFFSRALDCLRHAKFPARSAIVGAGGLFLFLLPLAPVARAHATLEFHAIPTTSVNRMFLPADSATEIIHGLAIARLRPDRLEIELTLADSAAYSLLANDPFISPTDVAAKATATTAATGLDASGTPAMHDPHFDRDQLALVQRGSTLFTITSNGAVLDPLSVTVEFTPQSDVVFHIIYPRPAPGLLLFKVNYFDKVPAGQKDLLTVLDDSGQTLLTADLGADNPLAHVQVTPPPAAAPPLAGPSSHRIFALVLATALALAALAFVLRLRHSSGRP